MHDECLWEAGCEVSLHLKHYSSEVEGCLEEIGLSGTVDGMREGFGERKVSWGYHVEFTLTCYRIPTFLSNKAILCKNLGGIMKL